MASAKTKLKGTGAALHSLRDGLPKTSKGDVCVLLTPASSADYTAAERIASTGDVSGIVILNGFAKVSVLLYLLFHQLSLQIFFLRTNSGTPLLY
jgi:hypothetical protein